MENQSSGEQSSQKTTISVQVPSSENIASRRPLIPTSFALAIVFFFFSFCTFQCQNQKIGSVTGFELVTGTNLKSRDLMNGRETEGEKIPANIWAIIALVAAVIGLGVFLIKEKNEAEVGTGAGIIGFASLLVLQFVINNQMSEKSHGQVEANFQLGYWGALISFGVASFISYLRIGQTHTVELNISPPPNIAEESTTIEKPNIQYQEHINEKSKITEHFDLIAWVSSNKKLLLVMLISVLASFTLYQFFIKNDPLKDAKTATNTFCNCNEKNNASTIELYETFVTDLKQNKYTSKLQARRKLKELKDSSDIVNYNCIIEAQAVLTKLRTRYITDALLLEKFDSEYNSNKKENCVTSNENTLKTAFTKVENQISLIKDKNEQIETHYSDINEFFNAFKNAVLTRDKEKLINFMYFPFQEQGSEMTKDIFLKNFTFTDEVFKLIRDSTSPNEYQENHFSIEGTGMGFSKHGDGYWKWDDIYYGE